MPRADFECRTCSTQAGEQVIHRDLDIRSTFCPFTGKKRGFKRLFNAVQISTRGHRVARFIDQRLQPQADKHAAVTGSAKSFERAHAAAMDKTYEKATPQEREVLVESGAMNGAAQPIGYGQPATAPNEAARHARVAAAFGSIDPGGRAASRAYTWPMVKRSVVPEWQHGR